jgi:hypothetical protein
MTTMTTDKLADIVAEVYAAMADQTIQAYAIYASGDELGGQYESKRFVKQVLGRNEAAADIAANHGHFADCPDANERLVWDGEYVTAEPIGRDGRIQEAGR